MTRLLSLGRVSICLIIAAILLTSCGPVVRAYDPGVRVPTLREGPAQIDCHNGVTVLSCTMLLTEDYQALVIDLKAKCLALGGSPSACQTTR